MKCAILFPGQASQYVGMGKTLSEAFPEARSVFSEADDALGEALTDILWDGPEDRLNLTENTQPGVLTVSLAAWAVFHKALPDFQPAFLAGHSLGEYSALVASGSLSLSDAVTTVRKRGLFMQDAVPVGVGAMAALMGIEPDLVAEVCAQAAEGEIVIPANDNAPGQVVIAGHKAAVERAIGLAKERGCKRAVLLPVSAPFHCPLMAPARERLTPVLEALPVRSPRWPVISNVDALPAGTGESVRRNLIAQVDSPVRWRDSLLLMQSEGVDTIVEVGPGKVLNGLAKRVNRDWTLLNVEDPASLAKTLSELSK